MGFRIRIYLPHYFCPLSKMRIFYVTPLNTCIIDGIFFFWHYWQKIFDFLAGCQRYPDILFFAFIFIFAYYSITIICKKMLPTYPALNHASRKCKIIHDLYTKGIMRIWPYSGPDWTGHWYTLTCAPQLLAHLSRRLMGELLVYQSLRRPSVVCRPSSVRPSTISNIFSSETTGPIKFKFHMETP